MSRIIGIDPGDETHGQVVVDATAWPPTVLYASKDDETHNVIYGQGDADDVVCEWLTSYGSAVGATTLDTARNVGRFEERAENREMGFHRLIRPEVGLELCGSRRAKKSQVREATRQIYRDAGMADGGGADSTKGTKKQPGPLYMLRDHAWDALAVVLAWMRIEGLDR